MRGNNIIKAKVLTSNETVKEIIAEKIEMIQNNLSEQNINLTQVDVEINQNNQQKNSLADLNEQISKMSNQNDSDASSVSSQDIVFTEIDFRDVYHKVSLIA